MEGSREGEEAEKFRASWRKDRDPEKSLELAPERLGYESAMLQHLVKKPDDYVGAFKTLPNSLQLLMVHSVQSLAFNHSLSERIKSGLSLIEPEEGDLVAPLASNGRIDVGKIAQVSQTNLERCRRNCKLGRLVVTGTLPGRDSPLAEGKPGDYEANGIRQAGLDDVDWVVNQIPRLTTSGTRGHYPSHSGISVSSKPQIRTPSPRGGRRVPRKGTGGTPRAPLFVCGSHFPPVPTRQ